MPLPTAPLRRAHGAAVGVVNGSLAVLAHSGADGQLPAAGLVFSLVGLLTWATAGFAKHELTWRRLLLLIGGGQLAMHVLVSLAAFRHAHEAEPARMLTAHVAATVVTVAVLAVAERTVLTLARAFAAALPRRLPALPASAPLGVATPSIARSAVVPQVPSWRGPPTEQV